MTPEEKAKDLLHQFSFIEYDQNEGIKLSNPSLKEAAKQCAIICVDEILSTHIWPRKLDYWQQVKEAISNQ